MLNLRLLGAPQIRLRDSALHPPLSSAKSQALLFFLATNERPQSRLTLAGLLWPEKSDVEARTNLRQALHQLREALPQHIDASREYVGLLPEAPRQVDAISFSTQVNAGLATGDLLALRSAAEQYTGDFLSGFYVEEAAPFEDWILVERERLRSLALQAFHQLANYYAQRRDLALGLLYTRRLLALEPLLEEAHQQLMRLLAQDGQVGAALAQFERCRQLWADELGVPPSPETLALCEQIRTGQVAPLRPANAAARLPAPLTSFIGRQREKQEIIDLLARRRLLTLTGAGGSGKTRLALQVAAETTSRYAEGAWLVELAALTDPDLLLPTLIAALEAPASAGQTPLQTLIHHLRPKELLLVLDNCEHLLEACAHWVTRLLSDCPHLKILATSREALGVLGEGLWPAPCLSLPEAARQPDPADLLRSESVQLFVERAAAVRPDFCLTRANAAAVAEICRRLDGIPLALELAAARMNALTPEDIAARLNDRFNLLLAGNRAALPRHRTLRAAIDWSYAALPAADSRLFRHLAVLTGGFSWPAAEALADGATPDQLTHLVDKSLALAEPRAGGLRYRLLDTLRAYALEKLTAAGEAPAARQRHLEWCARLVEQAEPHFFGAEQAAWFDQLELEHDNLRAALDWAEESGQTEAALRLAGALWAFWFTRGYFDEGWRRLKQALSGPPTRSVARARALNAAGGLLWSRGDSAEARALLEEALALGQECGDALSVAWSHLYVGSLAYAQGDSVAARARLQAGLAAAQAAGPSGRRGQAWAWMLLGDLELNAGQLFPADQLYADSATLLLELGDHSLRAYPLRRLGQIAAQRGQLDQAEALGRESLAINLAAKDAVAVLACLAGLAGVTAGRGQWARAARMLGAIDRHTADLGAPLWPADRLAQQQIATTVRTQLTDAAWSAAWSAGAALSFAEAARLGE